MNRIKLKVCGMREPENIRQLAQLPVDFLGFIFYNHSPRTVDENNSELIQTVKKLPERIKKVGVFVNESPGRILEIAHRFRLDSIQLHGEESVEICRQLKSENLEVIKVVKVSNSLSEEYLTFESACDFLLFEAKGKNPGGNNLTFDWRILSSFTSPNPFFLSGGISPTNVSEALTISSPKFYALDINSGFEVYPGFKNISSIKNLIKKMNHV